MRPTIALIAAVADNGIIGIAGALPWRLSTDMKRFRALTLGKPVIMGRRTFDSLGRPLADRDNIVVTSSPLSAEGVIAVRTLDEAIDEAERICAATQADEIMVIGGGKLYAAAIDRADRLYLTHVHAEPDGDAAFPAIDDEAWRPARSEAIPAGDKDEAASTFTIYERIADAIAD